MLFKKQHIINMLQLWLFILIRPRHFGRDCRNPDYRDSQHLTLHETECPFPEGGDALMDLAETSW